MVVILVIAPLTETERPPILNFNTFEKKTDFSFVLLSKKRKCQMRFFNIQTGQSENEAKLEHPSGKMTLIMTWAFELIKM